FIFVIFMLTKGNITHQADYIAYFPSDDPVVKNNELILGYTGGAQSMNVTLKAPEGSDGYFLHPENLEKLNEIENKLQKLPNVQKITSFSTMLKNANRVMQGKYELPENKGLIMLLSRYLKLVNGQGISGTFISNDFNSVTIYIRTYDQENMKYITEAGIKTLSEQVDNIVSENISTDVDYALWGDTVLFMSASQIMNKEQVFSTDLSLFVVFLITSIVFKSVKFGLVSLVPLLTGIMTYYITMAVVGIPMDMTTIMVTNIAIGVGVDDSIHFLLRLRRQMQIEKSGIEDSFIKTFSVTGRPIILTTLSIIAGLLILCFASFKPIKYFSILVSISLLAAMLGTLLFIAVFINFACHKKKKTAPEIRG
ncbi:MAG: efflux RND transporter permease subunit, partial [Spirochaetales bacterium]|nr:efflux RND transporter permease subunit [Spirochaetales bacterium]